MLSQGFFLTEISLNGLKFSLLNNNTSLCRWLKLLSPVANISSIILPAVSRWPYLNNNNSFIIFTKKIMGLQLLPTGNGTRTNPGSIPTQDMGLHYKGTTRPETCHPDIGPHHVLLEAGGSHPTGMLSFLQIFRPADKEYFKPDGMKQLLSHVLLYRLVIQIHQFTHIFYFWFRPSTSQSILDKIFF